MPLIHYTLCLCTCPLFYPVRLPRTVLHFLNYKHKPLHCGKPQFRKRIFYYQHFQSLRQKVGYWCHDCELIARYTFRLSRSVPFPHGGRSDPISKKNKCKTRPRTALLCGSGPGCFFLMSSYGQRVLRSICSLNASSRVASWAGFHSAGSAWSALNAATGTPSSALRRRSTSGSVPHQGRQLRL